MRIRRYSDLTLDDAFQQWLKRTFPQPMAEVSERVVRMAFIAGATWQVGRHLKAIEESKAAPSNDVEAITHDEGV